MEATTSVIRKTAIVSALLLVTLAGGLFVACGLVGDTSTGTLVLSFAPKLVVKTIQPVLDMNVAYYDVTGLGPGGSTFEQLGVTDSSVVQASLLPGEWTITAKAYNADGPPATQIGEGVAVVSIGAGDVLSTTVTVTPLPGTGTLTLDITWPGGVLTDPIVEASLVPAGEVYEPTTDDLVFTYGTDTASYTDTALPNGYYTLSLRLMDQGTDLVWGTVEAVRIIKDQVSYRLFELEEDVNRGGLILTIDEQLENPIVVTLNIDDGIQVQQDQTLTVIATPSEAVDSYAWYLHGLVLPGTGDSVSLSGLGLGYYWLDVVVTKGSILGSATLTFQIVPPSGGPSGSWQVVGTPGFSPTLGPIDQKLGIAFEIDTSGIPYIAFSDGDAADAATVMSFDGASWNTVGVAGFTGPARYLSLVLTSSGLPQVAYRDQIAAGAASVMGFDGLAWDFLGDQGFSPGAASSTFLVLDDADRPYVAFLRDTAAISVMTFDGFSWDFVGPMEFSPDYSQPFSFATTQTGTPAVVYANPLSLGRLNGLYFNGATWRNFGDLSAATGAAETVNLTADSRDTLYLAFTDSAAGGVVTSMGFDLMGEGAWEPVGNPGPHMGTATDIAVGTGDLPIIVFRDEDQGSRASVIQYNGTDWVLVGDAGFSDGEAASLSVSVAEDGAIYVAFVDFAHSGRATVMKHE